MTGGGSGTRTASLTLGFSGDITSSFDLKVRVLAAAHNGSTNITSFTGMSVVPTTTYDTDDDDLVEISTLQQLNAVRWDLDGDGTPASGNATAYRTAFAGSSAGMGCPTTTIDADDNDCTGYELAGHLDFDTDGDGDVDSSDTGSYTNWSPIGGTYSATFQGNGYTIGHLTISRNGSVGLFNTVSGTVEGVGLPDASVRSTSGGSVRVGALAATVASSGKVIAS